MECLLANTITAARPPPPTNIGLVLNCNTSTDDDTAVTMGQVI